MSGITDKLSKALDEAFLLYAVNISGFEDINDLRSYLETRFSSEENIRDIHGSSATVQRVLDHAVVDGETPYKEMEVSYFLDGIEGLPGSYCNFSSTSPLWSEFDGFNSLRVSEMYASCLREMLSAEFGQSVYSVTLERQIESKDLDYREVSNGHDVPYEISTHTGVISLSRKDSPEKHAILVSFGNLPITQNRQEPNLYEHLSDATVFFIANISDGMVRSLVDGLDTENAIERINGGTGFTLPDEGKSLEVAGIPDDGDGDAMPATVSSESIIKASLYNSGVSSLDVLNHYLRLAETDIIKMPANIKSVTWHKATCNDGEKALLYIDTGKEVKPMTLWLNSEHNHCGKITLSIDFEKEGFDALVKLKEHDHHDNNFNALSAYSCDLTAKVTADILIKGLDTGVVYNANFKNTLEPELKPGRSL